jgi:lipoprotein-anchoring transpeptidase ErfK/SrfK
MRGHFAAASLFALTLFFLPLFAHAAEPLLTLEKDGAVIATILPNISSVGSLALGDLGTDGIDEIIVATGYGAPTEIVVLREDGSRIGSFAPYHEAFAGGASVALCDFDRDGVNEIVTGAGFSGGPQVRVFDHKGTPTGVQFFAYDEASRGGVNILCRDITGDGVPDIITAPGPTGGPHLRVFSASGVLESELMLTNVPINTGLSLFMLPGSDASTLFVTPASYAEAPFIASVSFREGKLVQDALESRVTSGSAPLALSTTDGDVLTETYGVTSAVEEKDGSVFRLSAVPTTALADDISPKYIHVDVSTQTLTAYEYGVPAFSFLVSTGVARYPTPLGKTTVLAKLPVHDYSWFYGVDNPANYSLPNVLWNLRFRNHYYIHSAYWHNNFGHRMSHGCVNVSIPNAEKVFTWAEVGTPVEIVG